MQIKDFTVTPSSAVANGEDEIKAKATVMDGIDYMSNLPVIFSIKSGGAIFSNQQQTIEVETGVTGEATISFVDTTAETVLIDILLKDEPSTHETLSATFIATNNKVDKINLLLTVDGAKADGIDENIAVLQTLNGAISVPETPVSVALTNGATFINGEHTSVVTTDINGTASLPFTNTTTGTTKLTAYLSENIAVYNSVTASFVSSEPEISLALVVDSDDAEANGKAVNRVHATVTDNNTHEPLSGQTVTFSIASGNAIFDSNNQTSYSTTTNIEGNAYAAIKDDSVESVTIRVESGDKVETARVNFRQETSPLKIEHVSNINKNFSNGGPTVAWNGASFTVAVSGGSGEYSWTVTDGDDVLSVASSSGNNAAFRFHGTDGFATFMKNYTLQVTDNVTEQTVNYSFRIYLYFTDFGHWEHFQHESRYPSEDDFSQLLGEWGDLRSYDGWFTGSNGGNHYWINRIRNYYSAYATNMINGDIDWFGSAWLCGYAEKSQR